MLFRSAVDWWFSLLMIGSAFIVAVALAPLFTVLEGVTRIAVIITILSSVALPLWVLFSTTYRVEGGGLLIRSGPFSWKIPLSAIESVRESRSLLSSPALSLDRLEIRYSNGKRILVSPADRDSFLQSIGHSLTR